MTFETIEMFPNKSAVALTDQVEQLYTIELTEDSRCMYLSAVMTREELSDLYLNLARVLYPDDSDIKDLSAQIRELSLKIDNQLSLFEGGK